METHSYLENEPDLYLILRDKIYPTHLSLMKKSCFISKKLSSGENVLILNIEAEVLVCSFRIKYFKMHWNWYTKGKFHSLEMLISRSSLRLVKSFSLQSYSLKSIEIFLTTSAFMTFLSFIGFQQIIKNNGSLINATSS